MGASGSSTLPQSHLQSVPRYRIADRRKTLYPAAIPLDVTVQTLPTLPGSSAAQFRQPMQSPRQYWRLTLAACTKGNPDSQPFRILCRVIAVINSTLRRRISSQLHPSPCPYEGAVAVVHQKQEQLPRRNPTAAGTQTAHYHAIARWFQQRPETGSNHHTEASLSHPTVSD